MPGSITRRLPSSGNTVRRLLVASMVIGFLSLIAAGFAAAWVTGRNEQHSRAVIHTYQVEQAISAFRIRIEEAETARRGYLIIDSPSFFANYRSAVVGIVPALDRLAWLTADNPHEVARIRQLRVLTASLAAFHSRTNTLVADGRVAEAVAAFKADASVQTLGQVRTIGAAMIHEERGLLAQRDAAQRQSVRLFFIILMVAGVLLVFVATITLTTVLRYTHDLQVSRDTLRDLADGLEDAVAERTADLTRANEEIQRFAYIVSHDLRSPLVNVMGFTAELDASAKAIEAMIARVETVAPELADEDARIAAHEDLPEAIGFIRSSTEKMDALINAILKLSREGRRVISPEPLAMDGLIEKIRDTLQHRLDERDATLIVRHPLPDLVSDRLAVDQIFSNLIENAVKYLKPGVPGRIEVRGHQDGARLTYEIEDNGRGIEPRDHQRVFDLFRRSGSQDQPGEGIGLAHVRALAYRLGGIIDVSSELGKGATFRLSLPTSFTQLQDQPR